jgi:hypothetical protein
MRGENHLPEAEAQTNQEELPPRSFTKIPSQNIDNDPEAQVPKEPSHHNGGAVARLPNKQISSYIDDIKPKKLSVLLYHNPETDKALASNIRLKTYYAKYVGFLIFIIVLCCIVVIAIDSKNEYDSMVMDETLKIENCLKTYEENRCHPHQRVPALSDFCLELEMCINADPKKVAKRSAAFSTLVAENANKLFGTLKLQTIVVICVLLFGSIISCNMFLTKDTKGVSCAQVFADKKQK